MCDANIYKRKSNQTAEHQVHEAAELPVHAETSSEEKATKSNENQAAFRPGRFKIESISIHCMKAAAIFGPPNKFVFGSIFCNKFTRRPCMLVSQEKLGQKEKPSR